MRKLPDKGMDCDKGNGMNTKTSRHRFSLREFLIGATLALIIPALVLLALITGE